MLNDLKFTRTWKSVFECTLENRAVLVACPAKLCWTSCHVVPCSIICNSILYNNIQSSLIIIPALYFGKAAWNDKFILDHSLVVWLGMEAPKICSVHIMNCKTTSCTKIWGALWIQARFWPWNVRHLKRARWFANVHQDLGYGPSPRYSLCTTMSATVRILQIIPGYDSFLQIPKIT